jgi:hypothetical protein
LFNSIRSAVAKADWYQTGYLANIVTYTVAKISDLVGSMDPKRELNFDAIWQRQDVSDSSLELAMTVAPRVLRVLTSDSRPVSNVTEWAKRAECWNTVKAMPIDVPAQFEDDLVSRSEATERKRSARQLRKVDDGIECQAEVLAVPAHEWVAMAEFAASRRLLSPAEAQILALVTGARPGIPSELQSKRLLALKDRVIDNGYAYLS